MKIDDQAQKTALQEQEIAKGIATLLDAQAFKLDAQTASKLNYARQQALANMARPSSGLVISQNGMLRAFGDYWHQYRLLMTLMMCGLALMALFTIQNMTSQELVTIEDADLLASDLPPEVYLNEGFGTWLSENTQ
jgi:hypothetical protein